MVDAGERQLEIGSCKYGIKIAAGGGVDGADRDQLGETLRSPSHSVALTYADTER